MALTYIQEVPSSNLWGTTYTNPVPEFSAGIAINPLNATLNLICHMLALLGAHRIFHVNVLRVNISS